ncbi:MAG: baseplate J/gp47 family protein, partial [Spirochaetales bacterium]|nr:baseplate J/gp47 family protein [Spirochaetales bacterium]
MTRIPTIQEIRDQILADIEAASGASAPLLPRSTWRIVATALAGALALVYRFGGWVRRQIFIATCDAAALSERGGELGLVPKAAVAWRGTARVTGIDGTTVPAGRLFRAGG